LTINHRPVNMTDQPDAAAAFRARLEKALADLQPEIDELRVKLHLAKADARDEFARWEGKLADWRARADSTGGEAGDIMEETARAIAADLRDGIARLRKLM
jgi:hypothetical protein